MKNILVDSFFLLFKYIIILIQKCKKCTIQHTKLMGFAVLFFDINVIVDKRCKCFLIYNEFKK